MPSAPPVGMMQTASDPFLGYTRFRPIVIEDNSFIGAGTLILPGVRIGHDTIIGAGSVVTHDIPANSVAFGNPAEVHTDMPSFLHRRSQIDLAGLGGTR